MKLKFSALLVVLGITFSFGQEETDAQNLGDNFSLEGALATFNQEYLEIKKLLDKLPRKFPALENIIEELLDRDH